MAGRERCFSAISVVRRHANGAGSRVGLPASRREKSGMSLMSPGHGSAALGMVETQSYCAGLWGERDWQAGVLAVSWDDGLPVRLRRLLYSALHFVADPGNAAW